MTFDSFIHKVDEIKVLNPKGVIAHEMMIPKSRSQYLQADEFLDKNPRYSAVTMLLYPKEGITNLLLIERAIYKGVHSGQIAFPGGKYEDEDVNLENTALREMEEEVGISAKSVEIVKPYTKIYIPPSNFIVQPYLVIATDNLNFMPSPYEVAKLIEMPLKTLFSEDIVEIVSLKTSYAEVTDVPAFSFNNHIIWGATAMMLSELKETLKEIF